MHYIVTNDEKIKTTFTSLRKLEDGRVVMPISALNRINMSIYEAEVLTDRDLSKLK